MRSVLLLLIGFLLHGLCAAQACYLVDSVRFSVAAPTTEDALIVMIYGDLIGVRTHVIAASANVAGQQVVIHIDVSCDTSSALVTSHREKLPIEGLNVGPYHVRLMGSGATLMDTTTVLFVAPYAGRYQPTEPKPEMIRFDAGKDEIILDIDPSLYVLRVHIHGTDAQVKREAFIDGFGPTHISAKGLPDGNYLVCVDSDTVNLNGWVTVSRQH